MGTIMPYQGDMEWIDKHSIAAYPARQEFERGFGFSVDVLPDHHWGVAVLNGEPQVMIGREGLRVLAMFSPNPEEAHRTADKLIQDADRLKGEQS